MPGVKGKSGGPRPGAGRKPKTWQLKDGDQIIVQQDGGGSPLARIEISSYTALRLVLPDGSVIKLVR